jgi:hypothetical protein
MAQTARVFPLRRSIPSPREAERRELMEELSRTRVLTNQAYSSFNNTKDADLIESYVYEINALQARYNYLLRRVKELEVIQ